MIIDSMQNKTDLKATIEAPQRQHPKMHAGAKAVPARGGRGHQPKRFRKGTVKGKVKFYKKLWEHVANFADEDQENYDDEIHWDQDAASENDENGGEDWQGGKDEEPELTKIA